MGGGWRKPKPPAEFTMYDDVNLDLIPRGAQAVAGYVNGRYQTWPEVVKLWPRALRLSIAVSDHADAQCLDIERGDAINAQAPAWTRRQIARGVNQPVLYTSVSNAQALIGTMRRAGFRYSTLPVLRRRNQFKLWTAHYTDRPHICSKACGFGPVYASATQYTDKALGRSLDASLCAPDFLGGNL